MLRITGNPPLIPNKFHKKGSNKLFDPTSTYEKHALWEGNYLFAIGVPKKLLKQSLQNRLIPKNIYQNHALYINKHRIIF
jgi:hypothetical protein